MTGQVWRVGFVDSIDASFASACSAYSTAFTLADGEDPVFVVRPDGQMFMVAREPAAASDGAREVVHITPGVLNAWLRERDPEYTEGFMDGLHHFADAMGIELRTTEEPR